MSNEISLNDATSNRPVHIVDYYEFLETNDGSISIEEIIQDIVSKFHLLQKPGDLDKVTNYYAYITKTVSLGCWPERLRMLIRSWVCKALAIEPTDKSVICHDAINYIKHYIDLIMNAEDNKLEEVFKELIADTESFNKKLHDYYPRMGGLSLSTIMWNRLLWPESNPLNSLNSANWEKKIKELWLWEIYMKYNSMIPRL